MQINRPKAVKRPDQAVFTGGLYAQSCLKQGIFIFVIRFFLLPAELRTYVLAVFFFENAILGIEAERMSY